MIYVFFSGIRPTVQQTHLFLHLTLRFQDVAAQHFHTAPGKERLDIFMADFIEWKSKNIRHFEMRKLQNFCDEIFMILCDVRVHRKMTWYDLSVTCQVTCPSWSGPGSFILPAAHMALQLGPIWSTGLTLPGPPATSTMLAQYSTHLHTTIGFSIDINYYQLITVDLNWIKPVKVRSGLAVHIIFCPQKYC